jgi:hypothetical protein
MKDIRMLQEGPLDVATASDGRLVLITPILFKRSSGRAQMALPDGAAKQRPWDVRTTPLQLALARGYKWLAMVVSGEVGSFKELAAREGVDNSYVSRMVNLTTLSPDIVEAILDDALPDHLTLFDIAVDPPALWEEQRLRINCSTRPTCHAPEQVGRVRLRMNKKHSSHQV